MILLAALLLWALVGLLCLFARHRLVAAAGWLLDAAGCVLAVVAGGRALAGHDGSVPLGVLGDLGELGRAGLQLDRLGGLFAVIAFGVAAPACLAGTGHRGRRRLPAAVALCLLSVALVLSADHVFVLLLGWEGLTAAFFLLTGFDRSDGGPAVAAATFGKASGAALLVGALVAARSGGGLSYLDLGAAHGEAAAAALALLLAGFGIKVGLVPVQIWLPPAYAASPGPARALMAGAAVNVGFYGMWRSLQLLGPAPTWLAIVVLAVGGVTALLGIAHGAVHRDLRGLVAWSSVENAGVIGSGFGVALIGSRVGDERLVAAGLLAATAQVIAHALGKSLLFVVTAELERTRGTAELDELRGAARDAPWTGLGLLVGSLTLAGLPLTAGFMSEWLTLESLMQQFRIHQLGLQLASAVAGALVALSLGVAGVTFVRLVAFTGVGGRGRLQRPEPWALRGAVGLLAAGCVGAAMAAPWEIDLIASVLRPLAGSVTAQAHASPYVVQPVYAGFSSLSPSRLWLVIPALVALLMLLALALSGRRLWQVRRVPAWSSASPGVPRGVGYTSFGYANPMRKVLANLLLTRHQLELESTAERAAAVRLAAGGGPGADEQAPTAPASPVMVYEVDVVEAVEHYLYRPAYAGLRALAGLATRLQSGRLDAYMAYFLVVLLVVIAVVAAVS